MFLGTDNYLGATAFLGASGDPDTPSIPLGTLAVTIGGITFASPDLGDWCIQQKGLRGWFDGAPVRSDAPVRPGQHGQFGLPAKRDGRSIGLTVWCRTRSDAEVGAAVDAITGLLADGGYDTLTVTRPDGQVTYGVVRINGQPLVETYGWQTVSAQLELFAPDPHRYGPTQTVATGLPADLGGLQYPLYTDGAGIDLGVLDYGEYGNAGGFTLTNAGNAEAATRFVVRGPAPDGFTLTETTTGRRLLFVGAIPEGSSVSLDSATGAVVMDGVVSRGESLTRREWTPVPAGGSLTFEFRAPSGSPFVTAETTETWW